MDTSTEKPIFQATPPHRQTTRTGLFTGKVALVTGSESGIGRETARELARQGAYVMLNGLRPDQLTETLRGFIEDGYVAEAYVADVTDFAACQRLIDQTITAFGRLDILVANASISMRAYFGELDVAVFRAVCDSNIYGTVYPLKAAQAHLLASKGCVTFISSISSLNGIPSGSAYCAGKAAVSNLAHTLRLEWHGTGLHVGVIHLGFTANDPDKRVLASHGEPVPLAHRPPRWQMSQQEVAKAIVRHIHRRRAKTVLTGMGKLNSALSRFFPGLVDRIVLLSMKLRPELYE
ncbi:SDR family NAD(P)-dependent oxidoreductase [Fibrella aquatica]|uniref:SDR family NAD(P)-dependent oxidoreductase n=1 Tax=Fibrella aquatica TaxID=3242487 RepID=UPI003522DB64